MWAMLLWDGGGAAAGAWGIKELEAVEISRSPDRRGRRQRDPVMLQSVRLSMVMKMADCICESISLVERFWENAAINMTKLCAIPVILRHTWIFQVCFCCGDEENGCHACVCRHLTAADQRRNVLYRFRIGIKG